MEMADKDCFAYDFFEGSFVNSLAKILKQGCIPFSINDVVLERINAEQISDRKLSKKILESNLCTIDAIIEYPLSCSGPKAKFVKGRDLFQKGLIELKPSNSGKGLDLYLGAESKPMKFRLTQGGYEVSDKLDRFLQGMVLEGDKLVRSTDSTGYTKKDLLNNLILNYFVEDSLSLQNYENLVSSSSKSDFNISVKIHKPYPVGFPVLRFWTFGGVSKGSELYSDYNPLRFRRLKGKKKIAAYSST